MSMGIISRTINVIKFSHNAIPYQYCRTLLNSSQQKTQFSSKSNKGITFERNPETGELKKKKTTRIPKITLLHGTDIEVTTVEEAQKMAKRRDLKLVKILDLDTKTERPVYRLMTGAEYHQEDLKQRERKKAEKQNAGLKGEKVLMINQNISEHDLNVHLNKMIKWIEKKYEVRIVINGDADMKKAQSVYAYLENNLGNLGRVIQKRQKGTDIRFQVIPPKQTSERSSGSDNSDNTKEKTL